MELRNSTALLLGGTGLVGMAVARRLLAFEPARIVIAGLTSDEVTSALDELGSRSGKTAVEGVWGNMFVPEDLAQRSRESILSDPAARRRVVDDYLGPFGSVPIEHNQLYSWLVRFEPDLVVDCVNTATAVAYQALVRLSGGGKPG